MSLIKSIVAPVAAVASLVLIPASASALSVKFFENNVQVGATQTSLGNAIAAVQNVSNGGQLSVTALVFDFPPVDQLLSSFAASGLNLANLRIEVTHNFMSTAPLGSLGRGSASSNFQNGGDVTTSVFVGDEEFTRDTLIAESTSVLNDPAQGFSIVNEDDYWVTHVSEIANSTSGGTGNAEWINPAPTIPLPAGGLLLLSALGAMGVYRARKS